MPAEAMGLPLLNFVGGISPSLSAPRRLWRVGARRWWPARRRWAPWLYLVERAGADSRDELWARERVRGIDRAAEYEAGLRLGGGMTAGACHRIVQAAMSA